MRRRIEVGMERGGGKGAQKRQRRGMMEKGTEETWQRLRTINMAEADMWDGGDGGGRERQGRLRLMIIA